MKHFITCLIVMTLLSSVYGQADRLRDASTFNASVDSVAEALVALAMNHPTIKSGENIATQFKYTWTRSKTLWLNSIILQGNVNEYSIKGQQQSADPLRQSTQYPRYNIGVILPVGMFLNNGKQAKSDFYKYQASIEDVNTARQNIRRDVLINYHEYLMNKQLRDLSLEILHDWEMIYLKSKDKFAKGEVTLESFYSTSKIYNEEITNVVKLKDALKVSEDKLESLIGMNLNDALQLISTRQQSGQ